jgi:hypothetical protein
MRFAHALRWFPGSNRAIAPHIAGDRHDFAETGPMSALNIGAAALAAIALAVMTIPATAAPRVRATPNGPPPFCIARGGGGEGGAISVHDCRYYDYQSCIQAAAAAGNCVRNIDAK